LSMIKNHGRYETILIVDKIRNKGYILNVEVLEDEVVKIRGRSDKT
jgi:hypothetical protein